MLVLYNVIFGHNCLWSPNEVTSQLSGYHHIICVGNLKLICDAGMFCLFFANFLCNNNTLSCHICPVDVIDVAIRSPGDIEVSEQ